MTDYMKGELTAPDQQQTQGLSASTEVAMSRAAQEVQASMVIASKFPRNEVLCIQNIVASCGRLRLAEAAQYSYKKGGTLIEGPSIRLAETIAQRWRNFDFGVVELERKPGESQAMAYAHDLETNVRRVMTFTIRHWRDTRAGGYALTDEREIYELIANMGSRRLRACILSIIPGDVVEEAQDACNNTLIEAEKGVPIEQRREKMVNAFGAIDVSAQDLTNYLGHDVLSATLNELVRLRKVFTTIKDGVSVKGEFFADVKGIEEKAPAKKTAAQKKAAAKKTAAQKKAAAKEDAPAADPKEDEIPGLGKDSADGNTESSPGEAEAEPSDEAAPGDTDEPEPTDDEAHDKRVTEILAALGRKHKEATMEAILVKNGMLAEGAKWRDLPVEVLDDVLSAWEMMVKLMAKEA